MEACGDDQIWHSGKLECLVSQTETSGYYSYKMVTISKWRSTLYILQVGHTCIFSSYARVFRIIWLNFTQETKKCLKQQQYELKMNILSLHDEALIETIKMDIWNTWFRACTRKLWYFKYARGCKTRGSSLENRRLWIWVEIFTIFD
jgi:hypothetical protein